MDKLLSDSAKKELYTEKKHCTIQAKGDPDFFFGVPVVVDAQEQPQGQLLPAVVDDDLMGENHGGQQDLTRYILRHWLIVIVKCFSTV